MFFLYPRFLIRDEFREFDEYLNAGGDKENTILMGQPGIGSQSILTPFSHLWLSVIWIGKTICLAYCLLRRLIKGQPTIYTSWLNTVISSGLTGNLIWQAGSHFPDGDSWNDGYAVYPDGPVYPILEQFATNLKARG